MRIGVRAKGLMDGGDRVWASACEPAVRRPPGRKRGGSVARRRARARWHVWEKFHCVTFSILCNQIEIKIHASSSHKRESTIINHISKSKLKQLV